MTLAGESRTGIVLSGGGARGAYEVGVLSYLYGQLAREVGCLPTIDVVSGTSVGAINGTYLASVLDDPIGGIARLVGIWTDLRLTDVLGFGVRQIASLPRVFLGGNAPAGVFDAKTMATIVQNGISWRRLARNLRRGRPRVVTVSVTHLGTGRSVIYVDAAPGVAVPENLASHVIVRREHVRASHVLASAAIPILFPPVAIGDDLYCDGGLRLNTPMAPAIHFGVDRMLVVGVATPPAPRGETPSAVPHGRVPGTPFLLGKVLNAFLLDHVSTDVGHVREINQLLDIGRTTFGADFVERMNLEAARRGVRPRRIVQAVTVRPSIDIGRLAGDHLRRNRVRFGRFLGRSLLRALDLGEGADADLASYLIFDGDFTRQLIDLGRSDAAQKRDELAQAMFPTAAPNR